jgi:hopanoid C-3 methylase
MKILLVRPPVPRHTIGLKHIMICEPLELEYVAAGLAGHEVQVLDLIIEKGLRQRLSAFKPDIVGRPRPTSRASTR